MHRSNFNFLFIRYLVILEIFFSLQHPSTRIPSAENWKFNLVIGPKGLSIPLRAFSFIITTPF
ncbi:hypothetical protein HanHA300_Chr00c0001g0677561 [Helianthus annuus]|nr:hypothetical protein HanHA300_Chr00c0001g0677561 [Helianthus annuus]